MNSSKTKPILLKENVKLLRRELDKTQEEFGRIVDLSKGSIAKIESGVVPPFAKVANIVFKLRPYFSWLTMEIIAYGSVKNHLARNFTLNHNEVKTADSTRSDFSKDSPTSDATDKSIFQMTAENLANDPQSLELISEQLTQILKSRIP